MMKNLKSLVALVLAVLLLAALAVPAMAEGTIITVGAIQNDKATNHLYTAYRIFSGTVSDNGTGNTLSDVQYSSGVSNTLITALQANQTLNAIAEIAALHAANDTANPATYTASTARQVAEALGKVTGATAKEALADVLNTYFTTNGTYVKHVCGAKKNDGTYEINIGSDLGYYFVRDDQTAYSDGTNATTYTGITKYILQVVGNTSITPKASVPTIDKVIVDGANEVEANSKSVGDTVTYRLKSTVPDISQYKAYKFIMQDDISDGLTLNKATAPATTFNVTVGTTTLTEGTDYTVTYDSTDADDFTIDFTTLYTRFKSTASEDAQFATGNPIVVEYTATINENAIIGEDGNDNDVRLIYTNDANWNGNGDSEHPNGPTGETPWDKVTTFITEIDILKIDGATNLPLENVTFSIEGEALKAVITYTVSFNEKTNFAAGETKYYKLKDGTFTTTKPYATDEAGKTAEEISANRALYSADDIAKEYAKTETVHNSTEKTGTPGKVTLASGKDGLIKFSGLGIGTYTIKEVETLNGYNKFTDPITVAITGKVSNAELSTTTIDDGTEKITWNYAVTGASNTTSDANHIVITVENNKGSTLPSTGGIGTTIFYVAGSILVLAAAILLITKRRMGSND